MKPNQLLLTFLPGFAPILIYIAVEGLFGEIAGLAAGISLGIAEFAFILIKEKRADVFTLTDTVLLVLMGAVSISLSNPVFFKLKPAVSGTAIALVMLAGSLGPRRLFLPYLESKMGIGPVSKPVADRMLKMIAGFGALTLAHSALTAAAALWWPKAAWDFIAGALFWILALFYIGAWTIASFISARSARKRFAKEEGAGEFLPLVDEEGRIVGKAPRPLCHDGKKLLHPVIRLWITDGKRGWWMQKRAGTKLVQPGKWDCAVGGHVSFGETVESALRREAAEEIGLTETAAPGCLASVRPLFRFIWESDMERELVFVFAAAIEDGRNLKADPTEVDELRLWTDEELNGELRKGDGGGLTGLARAELEKMIGAGAV